MNDEPTTPQTVQTLKAEIARLESQLQAALRVSKQSSALHVLTVALNFATWMVENGAGPTYSTFCDDFGYQAQPGEDRPALYRKVEEVLSSVGFAF